MALVAGWLLLALVSGAIVYCLLTVLSAAAYLGDRPGMLGEEPPVSILKPLSGADLGLEENLRSFFRQDYSNFEILFAVRTAEDPAIRVVEALRAEYPNVPASVILTGEPPYPNAKVFSLDQMTHKARHDLLVMSDSDVRVTPDLLRTLAAEFQNQRIGLVTCPYRAVGGPSIWSRLEAAGMNTEFLAGVLVARLLEGMKFALGPTIAARREVIEQIGGFEALQDYLAEDFVLGQRAAAAGWTVLLSSYIIEHRIGSQSFPVNLRHRLRWNRSSRRSRPAGYAGQIFTNPLPLALLLWLTWPAMGVVGFLTLGLRTLIGWITAVRILGAQRLDLLWLTPFQDMLSLVFWVAGFFGNSILWRGRRYYLKPDGKFELARR